MTEGTNDKVYIHEFIDIIGHNRAKYMHHMTANWSPIAEDEREQDCFGVWGIVGTTRNWPGVLNIWEEQGWAGLATSFEHEFEHATLQDPKLAKWWAEAAGYRRRGEDRVLVPAPWSPTIGDLVARGVRGQTYAHDQIWLPQGGAPRFLDAVVEHAVAAHTAFGWVLAGAWETAMVGGSECFLLWAIPTWHDWQALESAQGADRRLVDWRDRTFQLTERQHRFLLVDAPLSPMRIGRQPSRDDRDEGWME